MMPPLEPLDPPEGDIVPYPNDILTLSNNRWLDTTARIITTEFGVPVDVQDNTRQYWEGRAAKAGYTLAELLGEQYRVRSEQLVMPAVTGAVSHR